MKKQTSTDSSLCISFRDRQRKLSESALSADVVGELLNYQATHYRRSPDPYVYLTDYELLRLAELLEEAEAIARRGVDRMEEGWEQLEEANHTQTK